MTEFIDFEAVTENQVEPVVIDDDDVEEEGKQVSDLESLKSFIDDDKEMDNDRSFDQQFDNLNNSIEETLKEEYDKSLVDIENFINFSNFCESSEDEGETDEFKDSEKRLERFEDTLFPTSNHEINTFPNAILFAVRFATTQKTNICDNAELKEINEKFFEQLDKERFNLELDKQQFNQQCLKINEILSKQDHF